MAQRKSGPFLLPARVVLVIAGAVAVALGSVNLFHEWRAAQVDNVYVAAAAAVGVVWLLALITAFRGWRASVFITALTAFVEFGVIASSHFVSGAGALGTFVKHEGLPMATIDMALIPACMLVAMSAGVCWTNPRGRTRVIDMAPMTVAALAGAVLVILQATDDLHRVDFGTANPEDGAFAAAVLASVWLAGGLWISRVRRTGAVLILVATFGVWYSFVTLHLVSGGTSVQAIAKHSGLGWAAVAAAAAVLAAASFIAAIGILVWSIVRNPGLAKATKAPVRRRA
ncbi:MAG: hypothetical protein E6I88_06940 [Chloroflexi bacterium]|nr:MAG: hypothetical protein E6I88_06940 [Chloroflexota bacterium]TME48634.1 MAG: hypothetical protein E6I56_00875 [Chloroflexota bacterium]